MFPRRSLARFLSTAGVRSLRKIVEKVEGGVTTLELAEVAEETKPVRFVPRRGHEAVAGGKCQCVLCSIPVKVAYSDVLVLEQFMRTDGTLLPKELTGICQEQQELLERCVMQAHWSGLFPDRPNEDLDLSGYRRLNRYWNDDMDMFKMELKTLPGSWFYIKRYNPKATEYRRKPASGEEGQGS